LGFETAFSSVDFFRHVVGREYSKQLKSLTMPCDIISPFDRYAKPLGPDIGLKHLADVTLVRYPLRIGLGLDGCEQTLR